MPSPRPWWLSPDRFFRRVASTFAAVVGNVQAGKPPTLAHTLYLAVALLTFAALVVLVILGFRGDDPGYLLGALGLLVAGVVLLLLFPSGALPPLPAPVPPPRENLAEIERRCGKIYECSQEDGHPFYDVIEDRLVLRVTPAGDLVARQVVRIRASRRFQMILRQLIGDPGEASFWNLDVRVSATRGNSKAQVVVALPAGGTTTNRKVLLFFPPDVEAGVELQYELAWKWAGVWRGLLAPGGEESWTVTANSRTPVPLIRVELRVPRTMPVTVRSTGAELGGGPVVPPEPEDGDGNLVYIWEATDVPHDRTLELLLHRL